MKTSSKSLMFGKKEEGALHHRKEDLKLRVMEVEKIKESINGKKIIKTIVVPKKLVNMVIR